MGDKTKIGLTSQYLFLLLLILIGLLFILEANVSLKTNITFGDEGFHAEIARYIAGNVEYPQWVPFGVTKVYKAHYARPPLFNILEAGFLFVLGTHEIIFKLFPPFIASLIGISVFLTAKKLFNREVGLIATLLLITFPSFITYSVLSFDEMLFVLYISLFILTFSIAVKEENRKYFVLSALFAGLAILTKHAGIMIFAFLAAMFLYTSFKEKRFRDSLKNYLIYGTIVLIVSAPFFLRNLYYYGTPQCQQLPLFDESGCEIRNFEEKYKFETRTLAGGTELDLLRFGLQNFIIFTYGNIWLILIGLIGGLIILIKKRDKVTPILIVMLILGLIAMYQIRSRSEDAARQLLPWATIIAIVSSRYWGELYTLLQKYQKYLGLVIVMIILVFGYQNITNKLAVMGQVKTFSPLFFESCNWVKENLDENIVLMTFWGTRAAYSCQRTVSSAWADIRLNNDPESIRDVSEMHGITHLFIQKFSLSQQPSQESYSFDFVRLLENNPEIFKKVYENGPPLEQCIQQGGCDGNIIYEVIYNNQ